MTTVVDAPRRTLPRAAAFAVAAATLVATFAIAGAPAPLYIVYQQQYGISGAGLTGAFAVYILPAAAMLLICGRLSDHIGRRPVALIGLTGGIVSCLVLMNIHGLGELLVGRGLQGIGSGLAMSAIGAWVVDLHAPGRSTLASVVTSAGPTVGLASGAVLSGLLVQFGPAPTVLVWAVFAAVLALCAIGVALAPETVERVPGAIGSLRPSMSVPPAARSLFLAVCACAIAAWALGGFYQALGPSLAAVELHEDSHLVGGLVVASLIGTTGAGGPLVARLRSTTAMTTGLAVLAAGTLTILLALRLTSLTGLFAAGVLAGLGFGAAFTGAIRTLLDRTTQHERAGALSAVYLVAYVGAAIPAFLAGVFIAPWGLSTVTDVYVCLVVALAATAAVILVMSKRRAR